MRCQAVILFSVVLALRASGLVFRDGAYDGAVVRVGEEAPVADCTRILQDLERLLNSTSWSLHSISEGRAWLRDIQVVLPQSWGRAACSPGGASVGENVQTGEADMVVGGRGDTPRSLQAGGCGERGERVQLPLPFLALNTSERGGVLAREWARYVYGVFPETGFPEDPLYPIAYSNGVETFNNTGCPGHLLCPTSDYNPWAPTKQNLLCSGRSALDVMLASPDLREAEVEEDGRQIYNLLAAPRDPVISYTRTGTVQYVLVLDQDQPADRWTHLKRALYQFIELLPEGSVLSIISMTNSASVLLPPTLVTDSQREGLLGRIPRRGAEGATKCLQCGLQLGRDTLGQLGGSLVLVTGEDMEGTVLPEGDHAIFLLSYRGRGQRLGRLPRQVTVYSAVQDDTTQNALDKLTEAFIDIINTVEIGQVQKVHESSHLAHEFSGTFYIEESQSSDITISLNIDDEQKVEMFEVKDPTGKKNIFSKFGDGVVVFRLPGESKSGIWSFHARLYAEATLPEQEVSVTVLTRGDGVGARGLARGDRLVASVTSGRGEAVVGGQVRAVVTGPEGFASEVVLRDSGLGYPDITRADGLYTAMLANTGQASGYFTVRMQAEEGSDGAIVTSGDGDGDCCGSWSASRGPGAPTGQFTRFFTAPSIFLAAGSMKDISPPSKIPDLRLIDVDANSSSVVLGWTAPGGDHAQGRAEQYEVRCGTDPEELRANFTGSGMVVLELIIAGEYGTMEEVEASVPWSGQLFYYGVVAVDMAGNRGPVSNLVAAYIQEATTVRLALPLSQEEERMESSIGGSSWLLDRSSMVLAGGVVGGVILVVVSLVIGLLIRARRSSKPEDKERPGLDTYEAGFYPDIKISASVKPGLDGSREVYDWLEGSQGSAGSRPETAASTEESTASTGEEEEPASPKHLPAVQPKGDSCSFSYPIPPPRPAPAGQPGLHGRSQSYTVQPRLQHGGGGQGGPQGSGRHYRHRAQHTAGPEQAPQKKRRHESVV